MKSRRGDGTKGAFLEKGKSWREKLENDKGLPRVVTIDDTMSELWGEGTVVISAPREVDELMRGVQKGRVNRCAERQTTPC